MPMAGIDTGIGLLSATAVLYGFVIAYYTFDRAFQDQEEARLPKEPNDLKKLKDARDWLYTRKLLLDVFLILTTVFMVFSAYNGLQYLYSANPDQLSAEAISLGYELWLVLAWFLALGVLHLMGTVRRWRQFTPGP